MKKVFHFVQYELLPGVTASEVEGFINHTDFAAFSRPGMTVRMLKGDRGNRKGRYALIAEFDSVASRDQFFPVEGGGTSDSAMAAQMQTFFQDLDKLVESNGEWTDYVTMS
jgi:hypothetical protein